MGTAIDRFLARRDRPPSEQGETLTERALRADDTEAPPLTLTARALGPAPGTSDRLGLSVERSAATSPAQAARVLQLQSRTGLPTDLIERNTDAIEAAASRRDFNADRSRRTSPIVAQWMAEHPTHAAAVGDERDRLAGIERAVQHASRPRPGFFRNMGRGLAGSLGGGVEAGIGHALEALGETLGAAEAPGGLNVLPFVRTAGAAVKRDAKAVQAFYTPTVGSIGDVRNAGDLRDYLAYQIGQGLGSMGAVTAATLAAGPEAGLAASGLLNFGDIRDELDDLGVEAGPVKNLIAVGLTIPVAALDAITPGDLASKLATKGAARTIVREAAEHGLTRRVAAAVMRNTIEEGGTEGLQELIQYAGARLLTGNPLHLDEALSRVVNAGIGGALGGGLLGGLAETPQLMHERRQQRFFQALGDATQDSRFVKDLPAETQEIVRRMTQDGPVETLYAPIETWQEYWQSQGEDPAQAAEEVLGNRDAYVEALQSGADLAIPTARYATTLAPSEHHAFFANELRTAPDALNHREADALKAEVEAAATEAASAVTDGSADAVQPIIADRLVAAGRDPAVAAIESQVFAAALAVAARRKGVEPQVLLDRYGLGINRVDESTVAPVAGEPIPLETLAERAIAAREAAPVREAERQAGKTEAALAMYDVREQDRDARAKTDAGEFVYARTDGGALRTNLGAVSVDGLVDELARLFDANSQEQTAPTITPDENMHTHSDMRPHVSMKRGAVLAAGRIAARRKSIAKLETELSRRGVEDVGDLLWRRMTGQDMEDATDFSFDQSAAPTFLGMRPINEREQVAEYSLPSGDIAFVQHSVEDGRLSVGFFGSTGGQGSVGPAQARAIMRDMRERTGATEVAAERISGARPDRLIAGPAVLLQSSEPGPRGRIRIGERSISIDLFPTADLSTFLHETGHFAFLQMQDQAARPEAAPQLVADLAALRAWVGAKDGEELTRDQHEQVARGFEAYLMEGHAPSSALRTAFARIRAWMLFVYRQLTNLHVELTPEVRGVFGRLLASDDEIAAAEAEQGMAPLFDDPHAVGMSDAEATRYSAAVGEARQAAEDELAEKVLAEVRREQTRQWKEQRAAVRTEVAAAINQEPASLAYSVLTRGQMPDGSDVPEAVQAALFENGTPPKLSRRALVEEYATRPEYDHLLQRLPRPVVYAKEGGIHPDQAADIFGFGSGDELIQALLTTDNPRRRIEALTDQRMHAEHGDLMTDGTLPAKAMEAVHNAPRAQLLRRELQHLASTELATLKGLVRKVTRRIPPLAAVRAEAERTIAAKRVRDINPLLYQRAEAKAARAAVAALLKGDIETAFTEKRRELLNHELYRAATHARETVDGIVRYMAKFAAISTRQRLGKAGGDYLEQIDAIRDRYDFARLSTVALDRRHSLLAFVDAQEKEGIPITVPDALLNEARRRHYKDATLDELVGLRDTVKQIEHLARTKNELLASVRARTKEEARTEVTSEIGSHFNTELPPAQHVHGLGYRLTHGVLRGIAEHTKMEFLFTALDGSQPHGIVWQYFFKPFVDAENAENTMRRADGDALTGIFSAYTRAERRAWFGEKRYDPELRTRQSDGTLTKAGLLAVALNWGNQYNRDALLRGYGWSEAGVEAALSHLDARDWALVQALWDHLNTYWPAAEQLEREVTGLAPEKVEATPFRLRGRDGTVHELKGGYYPIAFDRELSTRQAALDESADLSEAFGKLSGRAMTRHGHLKARDNTGGKPLLLELSVLTNHLNQVMHDLTHRRAVISVAKLVRDDAIRESIEGAVGREMYQQLWPWLKGIAGDRPREYSTTLATIAGHARRGATVVSLGLKLTSSFLQTLGYLSTIKELGPRYAALGLKDAFSNPVALGRTWDFITQRSAMMRDRLGSYDRDVRDVTRAPSRLGDLTQHGAAWFQFIGLMDLSVSIPTWLGAYRQAMDGHLEHVAAGDEPGAIDYADGVVRRTQAAGAAKDLASIQRGGELQRLFTMFYSSMSTLFNQFLSTGYAYRQSKDLGQLVGALALLWFVPAVMQDLLVGRGPDDPDDDDAWLQWLLRKELLYPFGTIVGARDLAYTVDRKLRTGANDFAATPIADIGTAAAGTVGLIAHAVSPDADVTRSDVKNAALLAGYVTKLPARQLWQTGEYFTDWMTGEITPSNPATGLFQALVSGEPQH